MLRFNGFKKLKKTQKHKELDKEEVEICETATAGLSAKAEKSGVSLSTLKKVYARGVAAWNSGHRPGTTPQQWGMARVNSYITKGKGTYHGADKDLREEEMNEAAPFNDLHSAIKYATDKVKTHRDKLDGIEVYKHKSGGYAVNHTMNANGRNSLNKSGAKHLGTVYKDKPTNIKESNLPEVPKDKESGLPKTYVAGLSAATAKARAAHFKKKDKLSDSDPRAYEPAPGDATAKTKLSKHTKKYHAMFGEDMNEETYEASFVGYKQIGIKKKDKRVVPERTTY